MNGRFEEDEPLRRRPAPTSSRRRRTDVARASRNSPHGGGESSFQQQQPESRRRPLHQSQQRPVVRDEDSFDEGRSVGSLHISQHDFRAESRPTNPLTIPRYIQFNASSEMTTRLDNVEQGFQFLLQSQANREAKPTTKIKVQERYPKLQRYASEEALPLIPQSSPIGKEGETRNFIELYTIPVEQRKPEAKPKWTPRADLARTKRTTSRNQRATSTLETQKTLSLFDKMKELETQLQVNKLENAKIDESQKAKHTERNLKERASRKLGEMLAKSATRQESTTTFATDRPFLGSLFANTSNTALEAELQGGERININKSPHLESSLTKRKGTSSPDKRTTANIVSQHNIDDIEEEEKERAALQRLKESGDLSNSLKAFLKEFHEQHE